MVKVGNYQESKGTAHTLGVTGAGLLVLHHVFREEYSYIRPFVIIGDKNLFGY